MGTAAGLFYYCCAFYGSMKTILQIFIFTLPIFWGGMIQFLIMNYFMKYATDILWIPPAVISFWFFLSRFTDALNDPFMGMGADSFGAKTWILIFLPITAYSFYAIWLPAMSKSLWVGFHLVLLLSALSGVFVPHYSLSAHWQADTKKSPDENRHKVFGFRSVMENLGVLAGAVFIMKLTTLKQETSTLVSFVRITALGMLITFILFWIFFPSLPMKKKENLSWKQLLFHLWLKPWQNKQPRYILLTGIGTQAAATFLLTSALYYAEYVLQNKAAGGMFSGLFIISATISIPVWIFLLKKKRKSFFWKISLGIMGFLFFSLFFLPPLPTSLFYGVAFFIGSLAGLILFTHPVLLAEAVEEAHPKEEKGIFYSMFTMINKGSMAFAAWIVGLLLQLSGYQPNAIQTDRALFAMKVLFFLLPAIAFFFAYLMITLRFKENR
ncbi:MAG: MFS transporter [Candidatus Hydrogenedentota bacterium]|nr:MAG: MFS transporter [Candidatus Hydrogenedentota bacterium]